MLMAGTLAQNSLVALWPRPCISDFYVTVRKNVATNALHDSGGTCFGAMVTSPAEICATVESYSHNRHAGTEYDVEL